MRFSVLRAVTVVIATATLWGCPFSPMFNDLKLRNNSDDEIRLFINLHYPDSSFQRSMGAGGVDAHRWIYVLGESDLKRYEGLTLFVFDHGYWRSRWNERVGRPHTYLEEDKILKKYYLSKHELNSLGWVLVYP